MFNLSYFSTLLLTIAIELAVVVIFSGRELRTKQFFASVILVNLITHPILSFVLLLCARFTPLEVTATNSVVVMLELAVVAAEYLMLRWVTGRPKLWRLSIGMNLASYLAGFIVASGSYFG